VGAAIDTRIRKTQHDLEKRLQSLEQRLANEKNKSASLERRLQKQLPAAPTTTTHQQSKDTGAQMIGAETKKYTIPKPPPAAHKQTTKPRWIPPTTTPPTTNTPRNQNPYRAASYTATTPNTTERGSGPYTARAKQRARSTPTHFNASRHHSS
jgi:TolA-binding protein